MLWFKKKEKKTDPGSFIQEKWETNFSLFQKHRFRGESGKNYFSRIGRGSLSLVLNKKNLFAWTVNPFFRYTDFCLEYNFSFGEENGYSASGFLLKYINDENYYYFLVSNSGYFRFDLVFNGNPIPLIAWTESSSIDSSTNSIRIISHGKLFSFFINDEWVAEIEDEGVMSGGFAFCAQNYNEKDRAEFFLNKVLVESRPVNVETYYYRWTKYFPIGHANRIIYAKTLFSQRQFALAAVQLKKAFRTKSPSSEDYFLLAECCINLKLYKEALECTEKSLAINPDEKDVILEKANLLYLLNRFIEFRDYLKTIIGRFKDSSYVWNLYGNAEYSLGNWKKSASCYKKAMELDDKMPLYMMNAAYAFDRLKETKSALECYLKAARLFFRQEAYEDLKILMPRIMELDPENPEVRALRGKVLFHEKNIEEAETIFKDLLSGGYRESSVCFMRGMILVVNGKREEALSFFKEAAEKEPDFYLYWLKYAESLFILKKDCLLPLEKAIEKDPSNIWVLNLAGQYYLKNKNIDRAAEFLKKAALAAPEEIEIVLNYSEALFRQKKIQEAFKILSARKGKAEIHNKKGNFLSILKKYEEAVKEYEKALSLNPDNPAIIENCARAYIELNILSRAEELLVKLLDMAPAASIYNLIGRVAVLKGEYPRAEAAFKAAAEDDPENTSILYNLADIEFRFSRYDEAVEILNRLLESNGLEEDLHKDVGNMLKRIKDITEVRLSCFSCGREWSVKKNIPPQPVLRLRGEPPGEAPAGKCKNCGSIYCVECGKKNLRENRFICPRCDEYLKLSDDYIKYLVSSYVNDSAKP